MTAVTKEIKKSVKDSFRLVLKFDFLTYFYNFSLGFARIRAGFYGVSLGTLALCLVAGERNRLKKSLIICGRATSGIFSSVFSKTPLYIPYLVALAVYRAIYLAVKDDRFCLVPTAVLLWAARVFVTYHGYPRRYVVYGFLEAFAFLAVSGALRDDADGGFKGIGVKSFESGFDFFIRVFCVCAAFTGLFDSRLYFGCAVACALSWYYCRQGAGTRSLLCLLCALVLCADRGEFAAVFPLVAGFWAVGEYLCERTSLFIYPAVLIASFSGNLALIGRINDFAPFFTAALSLAVYPVLLREMHPGKEGAEEFFKGKDARALMTGIKKLESSLNFLAGCAVDISDLNEKRLRQESVEDMTADSVCRNCQNNTYCWQERYSDTYRRFTRYIRDPSSDFPSWLCSVCPKKDRLKETLAENYRLSLSKKYMRYSQKTNLRMLREAFMSVASAVGDVRAKCRATGLVNSTATMLLDKFLNELGILHTYCLCCQNPGKADFACLDPVGNSDLYKIKARLENIYGEKFRDPAAAMRDGEIIYTLFARPAYSYSVSTRDRAKREINGDSFESFCDKGCLYMILSDGMGTGAVASAESRTALSMAKSLLSAGVTREKAVNLVNFALNLKGGGESTVTLDILRLDLFTGRAKLVKAGAPKSFVIGKKGILEYYGDSLPIGVVRDVKSYRTEFTLSAGDVFVMTSDGVTDIVKKISEIKNISAEKAAQSLVSRESADDMTVAILKIFWRQN